jgi:hypothetical protein
MMMMMFDIGWDEVQVAVNSQGCIGAANCT